MSENGSETSEASCEKHVQISVRGQCCQFVWDCSREYPSAYQDRVAGKRLKPADFTCAALGAAFKKVLKDAKHGPHIVGIHVFSEQHRRTSARTGQREEMKFVVLKLKASFAHKKLSEDLRDGIRILSMFARSLINTTIKV